jgi:uncharacterized protein YndB with AHSA1/START domain
MQTIRQQLFYPHPPEMVWAYLTTPELLTQWLMPNDIKPIEGHSFRFTTNPLPQLHFDGVVYCEVLEVIPFTKLSYSWKGGPGDGSITLDTLVVWTLVEKDNGSELRLEHSGFNETDNLAIFAGMSDGWTKILQRLAERITTANA